MSKHEKLIARLLTRPTDFTYPELVKLLFGWGYEESSQGKTSGSRVAFINRTTQHIIRLHKPHPGNVLKRYQVDLVIEELKNVKLL
ncbi:type II toxin-antitoxin system HicA family toxin [Chitinophaga japonensis]|uniref:HicA-like toxin of HicAB toxin-antitoxin system n=1 Tax=Chitinophaga japonensis TaxID=104662 RepID=A0A562TEF0_CHIJA|nr:type II toxin-antitoxin system HicA family toxin [Chitinophaga japonensis]TWI91909.1 HicA-like toxin of HicAB toxin-antitoxin system [Chitinophaga japonensis]